VVRKNCPICGVENTGGWPHTWHKSAHRKKAYTVETIQTMSEHTREWNEVKAILCDAVDDARAKEYRREYHREYYHKNIERRREQRRVSKAMRRRLRPLIADLCRAVELGRISARW
jgi:hypothetical protein